VEAAAWCGLRVRHHNDVVGRIESVEQEIEPFRPHVPPNEEHQKPVRRKSEPLAIGWLPVCDDTDR
jgi:hypothetical protein